MRQTDSEPVVRRVSRRELMASGITLGATAVASQYTVGDVLAQSGGPTDEISGTVTDSNGAVDGATVVAVPHDSSLDPLVTTTDANGDYVFDDQALHAGEKLYHVIARDGTETSPQRGQKNYPFIAAEGAGAIPDSAVAQYDATQASFSDGVSVGTATDFINANDLGNGNATYKTSVQNGNAVYRYDGVDDGHYTGAGAFSVSQPLTFMVVAVSAAQGASDEAVMARADSNDTNVNIRWDGGSSAWALGADVTTIFGNATTAPVILTGIIDGENSKLRENGTQSVSGDIGSAGMGSLNLGSVNGNATWFLDGDIGEALVYNANLETAGDLSSEEQRLADKWGITL